MDVHIPPAVIKRLESGAFQSLCTHLRERSDQVSNIDLMTVSGFCRNCLSKWLVVEARKLSDSIQKKAADGEEENKNAADEIKIVQALDAMGYDEAAQHVYGMMYPEWKKRHAQKASDEQMQKFSDSKPLWAAHNKQVLAKRREEKPSAPIHDDNNNNDNSTVCTMNRNNNDGTTTKPSLLSNVCCEDTDNIDNTKNKTGTRQLPPTSSNSTQNTSSNTFVPPALPTVSFSLAILTVSDRAFSGDYQTGDLSGPAVTETVESILGNNNAGAAKLESIETAVVPDEMEAIQQKLIDWSLSSIDLVITTGGTGFSARDVTPEATKAIVERSCEGLMAFCSLQTQSQQPLAALSRGTAGVRGKTLIANLPGNPEAVKEVLPVLLPLTLRAVADMKTMG